MAIEPETTVLKSAVVTGAASGLGLATSNALRKAGYHVTGVDLRFPEASEDPGLFQAASDVASDAAAQAVIEGHVARWGAPRVLVNCAGIAAPGATLRREGPMPLDEFRRVLEINVVGSFNYIRLVARAMQEAEPAEDGERGVIINTSSVAAFDGMVGQAAYSASKGAIASMMLPLAREFGRYGIRVMAIAPGVMETPMVFNMGERSSAVVTALRPPFPDRLGRPSEFADLVLSIIGNRMLNGQTIRLDGGLRLPPR